MEGKAMGNDGDLAMPGQHPMIVGETLCARLMAGCARPWAKICMGCLLAFCAEHHAKGSHSCRALVEAPRPTVEEKFSGSNGKHHHPPEASVPDRCECDHLQRVGGPGVRCGPCQDREKSQRGQA